MADEIGFDWDEANIGHIARHGVKPEEAEQAVLNDPLDLEPQMVDDEMRFSNVGVTLRGRWLFVASTVRKGKIRIATAYDAPRKLIAMYLRGRG